MNFKFQKAFSLIEILIVVFIMSVAFLAFYTVSTVGTKYIIESKNRLAAVALVNEKMEIARNLKYDDVGLQSGLPDGKIPEDEDVTANGHTYHVNTSVEHVDDPMDGVYPTDVIPNDYKIVRVIISWKDSNGADQSVTSLSRFVPPGLETTEGGAPLAINVKGSDGVGVKQASVHIVNSAVVPAVNTTRETDDDGHIMIPSAPASSGGYRFTIMKSGYETVATVDPASVLYTPTYRHQDVLLGALNMYDYIEDKLSNLTVKTADYQDNPVGGISFTIKGGKVIGRELAEPYADVVNMDTATGTTDAVSGEKDYPNISPGNYNIEMNVNSQYEFIDFDPSISPAALVPDSNLIYKIRVADKNIDSIFIKINDADSHTPVAGVQVTLTDSGNVDIFTDKVSSQRGVVFYPDSAAVLLPATYTVTVEASGYVTQTKSVNINKLTQESIDIVKE